MHINEHDIFWYIAWRRNSDDNCTEGVVRAEITSIESFMTDNLRHISVFSFKPIKRLLDGFKKENPSKHNVKQPITEQEFQKMLECIPDTSHDLQLLRAALCWEQNGFSRSSEYTVKANKNLTFNDVKNKVSLNRIKFGKASDGSHTMVYDQYKSKCNQFGNKEQVIFACRCPNACAVLEVKKLLQFRRVNRSSDFLFRFSNGKFLTYQNMLNLIKNLCTSIGIDAKEFATHSLRKSATVAAVKDGMDSVQIMKVGNWRSINGFSSYPNLNGQEKCEMRRKKFLSRNKQ